MSILTASSSNSVSRGYDYFLSDRVKKVVQISNFEYEGYVDGSNKEPYFVRINIEHPKKSYCDCPHANGNRICKHMVALYFYCEPSEAEEYKEWLESDYDYDDEYDEEFGCEYEEWARADDERYRLSEKPLFFDDVLREYIDNLDEEEIKEILFQELQDNYRRTFSLYLNNQYDKIIGKKDKTFTELEKIHNNLRKKVCIYDYEYWDYSIELLSKTEKSLIERALENGAFSNAVKGILLRPTLAVYDDYISVLSILKEYIEEMERDNYLKELNEFLGMLKHYSIKTTRPKSNVLKAIYVLSDYSVEEEANLLCRNSKYMEYCSFILENSRDREKLYNLFIEQLEKQIPGCKQNIAEIILKFDFLKSTETDEYGLDDEKLLDSLFWDFVFNGNERAIETLLRISDEHRDEYIDKAFKLIKNKPIRASLYRILDMKAEFFDEFFTEGEDYLLICNADWLGEKYSKKLYKHFHKQFYEKLKLGKGREVYREAARYAVGIYKMDNDRVWYEEFIRELENSVYKKHTALFDEIQKAVLSA